MSILYEHNQEMFEKIETAMQSENKICIVQATGTGKSFLFIEIMKSLFPNKKALYVVPKHSIAENIRQYDEFASIQNNVTFATYARFHHHTYVTDFDVIFIDECHHLASPIFGNEVNRFADESIRTNNTYVFGLTATPIIKKHNIAEEYFSTVLYGLSMKEAIQAGLFQQLNYHPAIPDATYIPTHLREKYTVESSEILIDKVLEKYKVDRWVVYFTNIEELDDGYEHLRELFPEYKILKMHSLESGCNVYISEFNRHNGKIMLCSVSMLLEGVHLKNIEGVLLFRHITTEHTLEQIIGRLFSVGMKSMPVFIDVTSSFKLFRKKRRISSAGNPGREFGVVRDVIEVACRNYGVIDFLDELAAYYDGFTPIVDYKGYLAYNHSELASLLGISCSKIYRLRDEGKTPEEIIDYCTNDHYIIDYRGYKGKTIKELCEQLGVSVSLCHLIRKDKGYTLKQFVDYILDDMAVKRSDLTLKEAANAANVSKTTISKIKKQKGFSTNAEVVEYINRHYSRDKQAKHNRNTKEPIIEYKGITAYSYRDIASYFNHSTSWVSRLLKANPDWDLKDIIDYGFESQEKEVSVNYRGIVADSYSEISRQLGKYGGYIGSWLRSHPGSTIEDAIDSALDTEYIISYKGYNAVNKMDLANQLGISESCLYTFLSYGKSYEDIIDFISDKSKGVLAYVDNKPFYNVYTISYVLNRRSDIISKFLKDNESDIPIILTVDMLPHKRPSRYKVDYRGIKAEDKGSLRKKLGISIKLFDKLAGEENDVKSIIDKVYELYPEKLSSING